MERLGKMYDIISKMDFFNQRAARELWSQKPEKIQNQDIFNRHQDLCEIKEFVDDVAELMDLEEQGLLLKLPCKVGDVVYYFKTLNDGENTIDIEEFKIHMFSFTNAGLFLINHFRHSLCTDLLNETVFLTKEEAEKALAKMEK